MLLVAVMLKAGGRSCSLGLKRPASAIEENDCDTTGTDPDGMRVTPGYWSEPARPVRRLTEEDITLGAGTLFEANGCRWGS